MHFASLPAKISGPDDGGNVCPELVPKLALENGVERDEGSGVLGAAVGERVPDDDHGDAAGQADEDEADKASEKSSFGK